LEDGTFVKLREMAIRYTFNSDRVRGWFGGSLGLEGLSLNVIGRNLITWTDYVGYDPEAGMTHRYTPQNVGGGSPIIAKVDSFGYPNYRTISFSVEAVF
jgi:hypothetical protein